MLFCLKLSYEFAKCKNLSQEKEGRGKHDHMDEDGCRVGWVVGCWLSTSTSMNTNRTYRMTWQKRREDQRIHISRCCPYSYSGQMKWLLPASIDGTVELEYLVTVGTIWISFKIIPLERKQNLPLFMLLAVFQISFLWDYSGNCNCNKGKLLMN